MPVETTLRHGTVTSYQYGCRCWACRTENSNYHRNWRKKRTETIISQQHQIEELKLEVEHLQDMLSVYA